MEYQGLFWGYQQYEFLDRLTVQLFVVVKWTSVNLLIRKTLKNVSMWIWNTITIKGKTISH